MPNSTLTFKDFSSIDSVNSYVADVNYGLSLTKPTLCFGFSYEKIDSDNFNYTLHYFDSELVGAIKDIPPTSYGSLFPFQTTPDMKDYS